MRSSLAPLVSDTVRLSHMQYARDFDVLACALTLPHLLPLSCASASACACASASASAFLSRSLRVTILRVRPIYLQSIQG